MIPKLSEASIRRHSSDKSFERGQDYYKSGSVTSLIQRGNELSVHVEGSEFDPYRISIDFDKGGITSAFCTCPYNFEGWCKHIIATLLTCLHQPNRIEQRPELAELLAPLTREQLQLVLHKLALAQPDWVDAIEQQIFQITPPKTTKVKKGSRQTSVDPKPIERQVERIIARYSEQWDDSLAMEEIEEILKKADAFIEKEDGNNGLIIVGAAVRAYVQDWMNLDGSSGESGDFFELLDASLTEAILSAELSEGDRQQWQRELETWQAEVDAYGIESFAMSLTALAQGWDYPPLQRVFQGEITQLGAWEGEAPDFADDLAQIRLSILERQERYEEYQYLAQAEGQTDLYLRILAKLGRTEEAIAQAQQHMTTAAEAFTLAQTLREQGKLEQALSIAKQGLDLGGHDTYRLAIWTSELAEGMDEEVALQSRLQAFQLFPSLADYLKVKELAGSQWKTLKTKLLKQLRQKTTLDDGAKVAIFLEEGLIEDAIATVDKLSSFQSDIIHTTMDAAVADHPEWVIENARRRAESIMNDGKAQYYYHAANWLCKVRASYLQLGQAEEWKQYHKQLMQTHSRKRKLISILEQRDLK
jgi:uncharacterized Zn finger protein